ncbi:GNAT family N-acetyltransferase [Dysgonomonas sp. Marseille-P4677]|uniref:GNAT family N-acetyltransferase n=1 Tax=Dysgonomonas sp. Marseille-P4677 TaxID=2364790 RepID=UPI0019126D83|nr:GNAT family protein [Dysgonomonas sp. Marseille-P4677]MBK5721708.1 GNAT family N-acetyltransferase [Dysgonomonas sp. Marseille-P4677]
MKFESVQVKLKNNEIVEIREAEIGDAAELLVTKKRYIGESEFIPLTKEEFSSTEETEKSWIQSYIDNENSLLLVATHQKQIIGNMDITGASRNMLKHTAMVGIGIVEEWTNIGLGTELFRCGLHWAKNNQILELLWLNTFATNKGGLRLYEKFGFVETGRLEHFIKMPNGKYVVNISMALKLR